ncbi:MAG: nonstructural protein [Arizlama microvirus]|nr:MAG: nonstructural protein [Arizlama microvirus]
MKIYALLDTKSGTYGVPFFQRNDTTAARAISLEVNRNDESNMLNKYPEDFTLYILGEYDEETGLITAQTPAIVTNASKLRKE